MSDEEYEYDYGSDEEYQYGSDQGENENGIVQDEFITIENNYYGILDLYSILYY